MRRMQYQAIALCFGLHVGFQHKVFSSQQKSFLSLFHFHIYEFTVDFNVSDSSLLIHFALCYYLIGSLCCLSWNSYCDLSSFVIRSFNVRWITCVTATPTPYRSEDMGGLLGFIQSPVDDNIARKRILS
jgi:hypothetical protein